MDSQADATVQSKAFQTLYSTILVGIKSGLSDVITESFSRGLVPPSVKTKASNPSHSEDDRAGFLLEAIQNKIQNVPESYDKFADVLGSIVSFEYLAQEMREKKAELSQMNQVNTEADMSMQVPQTTSSAQEGSGDVAADVDPLVEQQNHTSLLIEDPEVKQLARPPEKLNKLTESQLLKLKKGYFCCGCFCAVIAVLTVVMNCFAVIEISFGIRILLGLDHCRTVTTNQINGSYNILFGSMLFLFCGIVIPIFCLYSLCRHFGSCLQCKWRVVPFLGSLFLIVTIVLSAPTFVYSIFVSLTIYGSAANSNCSSNQFYSTLVSLVVTHILAFVFAVVSVISFIASRCCKFIKS